MKALEVKADYINFKLHVWQDSHWQDIELPAEIQAALMKKVVSDMCDHFNRVLQSQMSDTPPGLAEMIEH